MPRKTKAVTSTPASKLSHKRQLSGATPTSTTPGTRSSKRIKGSAEKTPLSVTPKKSKYFESSGSEGEESDVESIQETESGYEDEESEGEPTPTESESEDEYDSEEDNKKRRPVKNQGRKASTSKTLTNQVEETVDAPRDLWREGVKTGLGPGKQVFIARPKPRGDGGIKYVDKEVHPNTMAFLADLKKNNDREWLKLHDPDYRQSWKDWCSFVESLTEKIVEIDETIPELPAKDLVFRIYRDVRFSSDPTPYKTHFSAAWSRTGRKGPYACYYVQIQPGGRSFVGSGLWMPEAQPLALLRTSIDRKADRMKSVLSSPAIRKHIFSGIADDAKKVVKAFVSQNAENALKTKPKGYEADNANIELLRLRNYTIGKRLTDEEVAGSKALPRIVELIGAMSPYVSYLNSVVMPDEDASSTESDESSNDSNEEEQEQVSADD